MDASSKEAVKMPKKMRADQREENQVVLQGGRHGNPARDEKPNRDDRGLAVKVHPPTLYILTQTPGRPSPRKSSPRGVARPWASYRNSRAEQGLWRYVRTST